MQANHFTRCQPKVMLFSNEKLLGLNLDDLVSF